MADLGRSWQIFCTHLIGGWAPCFAMPGSKVGAKNMENAFFTELSTVIPSCPQTKPATQNCCAETNPNRPNGVGFRRGRSSQEHLGAAIAAKSVQEQSGAAWSAQERPGVARSSHKQPGAARKARNIHLPSRLSSCWLLVAPAG